MILTAQHVRSRDGAEGINAFCRLHGSHVWSGPPPDALREGELVAQSISVPPGGNSVRSYLDLIAPDEVPTREISVAVPQFVHRSQGRPLPWSCTVGDCTFRFGVEAALHSAWREEFRRLLFSALAVRRAA